LLIALRLARLRVAMPLRAFLFSLPELSNLKQGGQNESRNALAGVFVFSPKSNVAPARGGWEGRNALAGVFVFSRHYYYLWLRDLFAQSQCPCGRFCFLSQDKVLIDGIKKGTSQCPCGRFCFLSYMVRYDSRVPSRG